MVLTTHKKIMALLITAFILVMLFWLTVHLGNVYKYVVTGAIFELVAIPSLLAAIAIPVTSIIYWQKQKWSISSPFLYIAIISLICYSIFISMSN